MMLINKTIKLSNVIYHNLIRMESGRPECVCESWDLTHEGNEYIDACNQCQCDINNLEHLGEILKQSRGTGDTAVYIDNDGDMHIVADAGFPNAITLTKKERERLR